jgi:exosortase
LSIAWLVSKAQWFWNHQPDLQFGWIVLLLCAYLFWEAWENRPAPEFRWSPLALALLGTASALLFLVQIYQAAFGTQPASIAGLALALLCVTAANLNYVFGKAGIQHFWFPFAFILIALPMPSLLHNLVVGGLQSKLTILNVEILNMLGIPAQRSGSLIQLPNCTVGVDEACSGIRSLQSTLMAGLFIAHLSLRSTGLKILLVLSGLGLAAVGNLARSLYLSFTASAKGLEALQGVHDTAGWSILLFTAVAVAGVAWLLCRLEASLRTESRTMQPNPNPSAD